MPAAAELIDVPQEVKGDEVTLSWTEPTNNGANITQYTVYQRTVSEDGTIGDWTQLKIITDISAREYVVKVEEDKEYEFVVTATNRFGEGLKEEGKIQRVKVVAGNHFITELNQLIRMSNSFFRAFNVENTHNHRLYTVHRVYITKVAVNNNLND